MKIRSTHVVLPFVVLLVGCAGAARPSPRTSTSETQRLAEEAALESVIQQVQSQKAEYRLSGADLLEITVFQQQDLHRLLRVGQNGTISFPLIGTVKVGGLTVVEAGDAISKRLRDYLIDPQVTIFIKEYGNKKVFVLGQVQKPGSFDLPTESKMTVLEAVSMAGGFTAVAAPDHTKVIRNQNGRSESFTIPVSDITRRGQKEKDLQLEPSDVVYVPQSFF